jgi:rhodanese-related sulfurtransferase
VRPLLRQSVLLLGLALLPAAVQALYFRDRISWESRIAESDMVSVDLARSWGADAIWIDARPDVDFERDHVPEAILLNEDRWNDLLPQFLQQRWSPEKKIVVYCSAESCNLAGDVARRLREEAKLPNQIRVLKGGWEEWLKTRK